MQNLDKQHLLDAFAALGTTLRQPVHLLIGGAGALILSDQLQRATTDCDVLVAQPDMGLLQEAIRKVADAQGLVGGWLNGSAQAFAEVLPPDYSSRLHSLPPYGHLRVSLLHRQDAIVMKLFAGRPRDLADVTALHATRAELDFASDQLARLSRIDAARTKRMASLIASLRP
jgi:Nucleotidyltransferase of unknown function (DUF6036)